jgi:1,4-dihydroxy-2-naphthoyl-CoA hydrolase
VRNFRWSRNRYIYPLRIPRSHALTQVGKAQVGPDGKGFPLAINLHTSLLGNQREGEIIAEARFVRSGKRVTVVRTRVTGAQGQLLAEVTTNHVPAM